VEVAVVLEATFHEQQEVTAHWQTFDDEQQGFECLGHTSWSDWESDQLWSVGKAWKPDACHVEGEVKSLSAGLSDVSVGFLTKEVAFERMMEDERTRLALVHPELAEMLVWLPEETTEMVLGQELSVGVSRHPQTSCPGQWKVLMGGHRRFL
jgi:hypothetical protein